MGRIISNNAEIRKRQRERAQTGAQEGWAVTTEDPVGSEETLKVDSQSWDDGSSVWRQRRCYIIWGLGPPGALPLSSAWAAASEVLNTKHTPACTHRHTHTGTNSQHPPPLPFGVFNANCMDGHDRRWMSAFNQLGLWEIIICNNSLVISTINKLLSPRKMSNKC